MYTFKRKTRRLSNKSQKRHLFLFDGGVLFCKKRQQPLPYSPEFYEHKLCIYAPQLGFAECAKQAPDRFELWDEQRSEGFAVYAADEQARAKWIQRLARMTVLHACERGDKHSTGSAKTDTAPAGPLSPASRPHSWTSDSTVSSRSSNSAFADADAHSAASSADYPPDPNGNNTSTGAVLGPNGTTGAPASPSDRHSTTTGSVSGSSRRSSSQAVSLGGSDAENNTTTTTNTSTMSAAGTPLPGSKSLQNTAVHILAREQAVSEV